MAVLHTHSQFLFLARYVLAASTAIKQPQPIVLDPFMKLPSNCKLIDNYQNDKGKQPWLVVSEKALVEQTDKKAVLDKAGVKFIPVKALENGEHCKPGSTMYN